ncbi:MAG TPA: GFA family protein [Polyangiaceae bacterium]|nr:GFA family protein [Polyangiaceae bacterium]
MPLATYTGTCHCGAVRFEADLDLEEGSNRCNCSYCAKARAWFAFAKGAERFRLLEGAKISEYRWEPPGREAHLTFSFCSTCGVRTFARGELAALGGTFHAISVPTLELSPEELRALPIRYIDGRHDRYDRVPEHTEAI